MNKIKKTIINENNEKIDIEYIGMFEIPDLNKKYIMYSMENEVNDDDCYVMIGEVITEDDCMKVVGILPEEENVVIAYYNEISSQLGE